MPAAGVFIRLRWQFNGLAHWNRREFLKETEDGALRIANESNHRCQREKRSSPPRHLFPSYRENHRNGSQAALYRPLSPTRPDHPAARRVPRRG